MVVFLSILVFLSCFSVAKSDCGRGEYETEGLAFGWFSKCKECEAGSYNDVPGEQCKECERGTLSSGEGAEYCSSCPRGHYADTEGSTVCTPCAKGAYTDNKGAAECEPCPAGSYNDKDGQAQCIECGAGHYSTLGAVHCTACDVGDTSPAGSTNSSACTSHCSGGYKHVVTEGDHTTCEECPAGTYSEVGAVNCTLCSAGYTSVNGSNRCTECGNGAYNTKDGAIGCYKCDPGHYANSTLCELCPEGFTSDSGAGSVEECYLVKVAEVQNEIEATAGPELDTVSNTVTSSAKSSIGNPTLMVYYVLAGVFALVLSVFMLLVVWKCRSTNTDKLGSMGFSAAETYTNDYGTCEERDDNLDKYETLDKNEK